MSKVGSKVGPTPMLHTQKDQKLIQEDPTCSPWSILISRQEIPHKLVVNTFKKICKFEETSEYPQKSLQDDCQSKEDWDPKKRN